MPNAVVTLKKGAGRTLKEGGPWIYDNEIESIMGSFTDGDIVLVHDFDGYPLGRGFINRNSKLTVRMMTRNRDTEVEDVYKRQVLRCPQAFSAVLTSIAISSGRDHAGQSLSFFSTYFSLCASLE